MYYTGREQLTDADKRPFEMEHFFFHQNRPSLQELIVSVLTTTEGVKVASTISAKVRAQVRETRLEPTEAPRVAQYVPGTRRARKPDAPSGYPNSGACSSAAARTRSRTS